jgi:Fur family ferric uptake transcriptional regulator
MMACSDKLINVLRKSGFRVTSQRAVILEIIAHNGDHLSVQEVYLEAKDRLPGLNLATVYRTLETMHQAGVIDLLNFGMTPARFSLRDPYNPHGHLVCRECEQILEIGTDLIARISGEVEQKVGFFVEPNHLTLSGLCDECSVDGPGNSRRIRAI